MKTFKTSFCLLSLTIALLTFAETARHELPDEQAKTRLVEAAGITVVESDMRATLGHDSFSVAVPVRNALSAPASGKLTLDLLGTEDEVLATASAEQVLKPGLGQFKLDLRNRPLKQENQFPWYRVRYRLGSDSKSVDEGIVALGAIAADLFDLTVGYSEKAQKGKPYVLHAHTFNPIVHRPVGGVTISALLDNGADGTVKPAVTKIHGVTDANGDADLTFSLPASISADDDQEIKLEAKKGPVSYSRDIEFSVDSGVEIRLQTDKPLYQPRQVMHLRSLSFGRDHHAAVDQTVTFSVDDPEGNVAFKNDAKTNKYGIASVDWTIPESARLGDYEVHAESDETSSDYRRYANVSRIRISQYDLPTFTLKAAGDRSYYLPNENAVVEIKAHYLFGEPVPGASVRVMPAPEGKWDWRNQKWEAKEGEEVQGVLDREGRVKLAINLQNAHEEFKQSGYLRFRDVDYVVSVTDPSTGNSERSRFTLRLSHQDIHVYVISSTMRDKDSVSFYVATYYPDGSPAASQVQISRLENDKKDPSQPPKEQILRTIKTNRYGLAKVEDLPLRQSVENSRNAVLLLSARDAKGRLGRQTEDVWFSDKPFVTVSTAKPLYREGDPVEVTVRCRACDGNFHVEIVHEGAIVATQRAHVKRGSAFVVFPYQNQFQGELTVGAYPTDAGDDWDSGTLPGSRTILFPKDSELKLKVSLDHETYVPAGEMNAAIRVRSSNGTSQQGALGVVMVDTAVEERVREDGLSPGEHWWELWQDRGAAGGIARHDLDQLDLSQPIPAEMELAAEIILNSEGRMYLPKISGGEYAEQTSRMFQKTVEKELTPLYSILSCSDIPSCTLPADTTSVERFLAQRGAALAELRDPWGTPFRIRIGVQYTQRVVTVSSAGPDKRFDTDDDFIVKEFRWNYFSSIGKALDAAVKDAHARSGGFIRDYTTLRSAVQRQGIDLDALRDPWGNPYLFEFSVNGPRMMINAKTQGGNAAHGKAEPYVLWTTSINYFDGAQKRIDQALIRYLREKGEFPRDEATFRLALAQASIAFDELRDPWGNPYYVTFRQVPDYSATVVVKQETTSAGQIEERPVTRMVDWIWIKSTGPDSARNTGDDFAVASFSRVVSVESPDLQVRSGPALAFADLTGAIQGVVTDPSGAVIAGAKVIATREGDDSKYTTTTTGEGNYLIRNLPAGLYSLEISAQGFQAFVVQRIPVHSSSLTQVDAALRVGATTETVEVTAAAVLVETTTTSSASAKSQLVLPQAQIRVPTSTPHLRQYFPETLYWQPSLVTDRAGNAALKVKLADTVTTWKLVAFASTEDGRVGIAEKDIRAFQPFFAEHEPPKILTLGDEIALPVIVRNYLKKSQTVDVSMKPANWFSITGPGEQRITVKQNDAARAVFQIHASESIDSGKQQVSAISGDAGDAVEKPVTVHPYGEKRTSVTNQVAGDSAMELSIPPDAIAGSLHAQLKIYPNLMAHVIESVEAGLERPYGCGEQTISSTYPNLMVVKYYQGQGIEPAVAARARRYLHEGYQRLLRYRETEGGFSYWGHGDPNIALTAYALRFLTEAGRFTDVDPATISGALAWLIRQQDANGGWHSDDRLSAYVLWTLADIELPQAAGDEVKIINAALAKGQSYINARTGTTSDPYMMALSVLAFIRGGNREAAAPLVDRLAKEAHVKDGKAYWELSGNTLFHSWGLPGQVEVTALVLRALHAFSTQDDQSPTHELTNQGLIFLARAQDQYGVWYSGQTTWNVLSVMLELTRRPAGDDQPVEAKILVNGKLAQTVEIPQGKQSTGPIYLDLTNYVGAGKNKIEVRTARAIASSGAQMAANYYVPWDRIRDREARKPEGRQALRLAVHFDKTQASPGESIDCRVEVERIGQQGWGMMLAEIGVPPGADVDRASLENAVAASGWELNHYEVLPDRVVVYVWPRAGGTKFRFTFKPRSEMRAYSAPSTLYDYYNPEAYVAIAPEMFHISAPQPTDIAKRATGR